jgi:hypothetical protein
MILTAIFVGCRSDCSSPDTFTVVDSKSAGTLVYRVSGFQEKLEFFELYSGNASFDHCGRTSATLLDKVEYDRSEGKLKAIVLHGKRLSVVHTNKGSEAIAPEHARLTVTQ